MSGTKKPTRPAPSTLSGSFETLRAIRRTWRGPMAATTAPEIRTATAQPRYSSTRNVPRTPPSTSIDPCMSSVVFSTVAVGSFVIVESR